MKFTLNHQVVDWPVRPDETLLEMLREGGIHSARSGCDTGNCGVCTVWVDEKPVLSCGYPATRAEGKSVTTLEGVLDEASEIMDALAAQGADQCGYCSPGLIMTILAMKRDLPHPTPEQMDEYLAGCLCRCTGYMSQRRALQKLMERSVSSHE